MIFLQMVINVTTLHYYLCKQLTLITNIVNDNKPFVVNLLTV